MPEVESCSSGATCANLPLAEQNRRAVRGLVMRILSSVLSLLFVAGTVGIAQSPATQVRPIGPVCPGTLTARHQGGPVVHWTLAREDQYKPDAKASGHAGLHVALASPKAVRQIELAVEFVPPGARVSPVDLAKPHKQREQSSTFDLSSPDGAKTVAGDLLLGPVFKIKRVRLLRVQYADGSSWQSPSCSVVPSLYMPVAAK